MFKRFVLKLSGLILLLSERYVDQLQKSVKGVAGQRPFLEYRALARRQSTPRFQVLILASVSGYVAVRGHHYERMSYKLAPPL